ncbi:MAG: Nif11-like leader peptide family RiPP precursor [Planctomycetota bacterium]|nr:Nif11-like leader peptide family RiPP precursor [Planctomycetota bacterium]
MSITAAKKIRTHVDENEDLQDSIRNQMSEGSLNLIKIGQEHGFDFSESELKEITDQGELSDFELELVSGGAQTDSATLS